MAVLATAQGTFVRVPLSDAPSFAPMTAFAVSDFPQNGSLLDALQFGDPASEAGHNFQDGGSEVTTGR